MNNLSNNILKEKRAELPSRMTQSRKSSCPSSTGVFWLTHPGKQGLHNPKTSKDYKHDSDIFCHFEGRKQAFSSMSETL